MQLEWYEKYLSTNEELGFCIEECDELYRIVGSVFCMIYMIIKQNLDAF